MSEGTRGGVTNDALAARGWDDDGDKTHARANMARAHGPAKEQEGIHGLGIAGQRAKQRAHKDTRTRTWTRDPTKH